MSSPPPNAERRRPLLPALGGAFIFSGLVALAVGWYGAAGLDWLPAQMPYLVSGGLGGLALLITGLFLLCANMLVGQGMRRLNALEAMRDSLRQTKPASRADDNGPATELLPTEMDNLVQVGNQTFHRPSCRYARALSADDATGQFVSLAEAERTSLQPCKVCRPVREETFLQHGGGD